MDKRIRFWPALGALALGVAIAAAGCGKPPETGPVDNAGNGPTPPKPSNVSGPIKIDGSTTVYPISEELAGAFGDANEKVDITVGRVGTGSGMKKFIAGEIDIAGASRPIKEDEDAKLKAAGVEYLEIPIAYDGVSVVIHPENGFADAMKVADLQKAFAPDSPVQTWKDINPAWPADKINFYGPSENHGTYEYFTEEVIGKKNEIRKDYQANQEYTAVIQGVAGDKNGIGYVGFNYFDENKEKVKAVTVDGVAPSAQTIEDGTYKPLSRPLFLYVSKKSYTDKPQVKAFVDYMITDGGLGAVEAAKYVKLPADAMEAVRKRVAAGTVGSAFMNAAAGAKIVDVLK
ncbi:MAG: PstS family phosphate ABC transporter substrate-binding protein [Fimbriimonas sp.]